MAQKRTWLPLILPLVFISLIAGIWAGWIRMGWQFPITEVAGKHGALMVGSFLGTLISLERAVVIKNRIAMLVPLVSGVSLILFAFDLDTWAFIALTIGSLGQVIIMAYFLERYKELYMSIILAGSICWLVGNLMLLVYNIYPLAVPWWMAFLLLVITGERLELTRFLPISKYKRVLLIIVLGLFIAGIIMPFHGNGRYLAGSGLILAGLWLLKYDMATKSVKKEGQHRFSALLLLTGYGWLMVSGVLILTGDMYGYQYDAVLHTFFVGFVFSMIFAHGPVIMPGVLGISVRPYHPFLYSWAALLQVTLITRVAADIYELAELRRWSAIGNGIAMLAFFISMGVFIFIELKKYRSELHNIRIKNPEIELKVKVE